MVGDSDPRHPTGPSAPPSTGQATLHVVTTDAYIPGEVFSYDGSQPQHPVLLKALYSGSNITQDLAFNWLFSGVAFQLPASPPDRGFLSFLADFFRSDVTVFGSSKVRA